MSPCLVCGHGRWAHTSLSGCRTSGCTCTTFQPADPQREALDNLTKQSEELGMFTETDEPVEKIKAAFDAGEKGTTGPPDPPDLHQAIQAATQAILHARIWDNPTIDQEARIAVEAAWPQALEAAINQLRALLISNQAALGQVEREGHPT